MRKLTIAALIAVPAVALAAGGNVDKPPKPTQTTTECSSGKIWDEGSKSCVTPKDARLDDETRYLAARELAWAGRYADAINVLGSMADPAEDRVLTYLGFAHRKSGDVAQGMAYYQQAIAQNPDNIMARSYMGQAYVQLGDIEMARAELREIRARGGRMTWAEVSLDQAIRSGRGFSY